MKRILVATIALFLIGCSDDEAMLKVNRDLANLQEQIYKIEREQAVLRQDLNEKMGVLERKFDDRTSQADTQDQIRSVKRELSQFQALVRDLESKIAEMKRASSRISLATSEPSEGTPPATDANGEPVPEDPNADASTGDQPVSDVSGDVVQAQFNQAMMDYNRGKYKVAEQGFKDILANFANSPYTERAMYYLGNSYFQSKKYEEARDLFSKIGKDYPSGDYVKQALYYEGRSLYSLNQISKAILTLKELAEKYPGTQEAELARNFLKRTGYER